MSEIRTETFFCLKSKLLVPFGFFRVPISDSKKCPKSKLSGNRTKLNYISEIQTSSDYRQSLHCTNIPGCESQTVGANFPGPVPVQGVLLPVVLFQQLKTFKRNLATHADKKGRLRRRFVCVFCSVWRFGITIHFIIPFGLLSGFLFVNLSERIQTQNTSILD